MSWHTYGMKNKTAACILMMMVFGVSLVNPGKSFALPYCPEDTKAYWDNCFGTLIYADGDKYVGEFKDDYFHGQGTYTFSNGDEYVGEFKDGKKHRRGTYTYARGDKYVGEFKGGKYNGQGAYTFADGRVKEGIFENNKFKLSKKVKTTTLSTSSRATKLSLSGAEVKCTKLGFRKGTEKYGDCVMTLID